MKQIAGYLIEVHKLQEGGYIARIFEPLTEPSTTDTIYGNTLIQIRQRIGKRLEKLIVEEES